MAAALQGASVHSERMAAATSASPASSPRTQRVAITPTRITACTLIRRARGRPGSHTQQRKAARRQNNEVSTAVCLSA